MAKMEDWKPLAGEGAVSGADYEDVERSLVLMIAPGLPERTLVVWRGTPIGVLLGAAMSLYGGVVNVYLTRARGGEYDERVWDEMRAAGISVVDG